jgi:hypothetical protein
VIAALKAWADANLDPAALGKTNARPAAPARSALTVV